MCLLFDRRSERAVRALWDQLESLGVPSLCSHTHGRHVPHLSYAALRSWDLASVTAALSGLDVGGPADLSAAARRGDDPLRPRPLRTRLLSGELVAVLEQGDTVAR